MQINYFSYIRKIYELIPDPSSFGAVGHKYENKSLLVLFLLLKSLAFVPEQEVCSLYYSIKRLFYCHLQSLPSKEMSAKGLAHVDHEQMFWSEIERLFIN